MIQSRSNVHIRMRVDSDRHDRFLVQDCPILPSAGDNPVCGSDGQHEDEGRTQEGSSSAMLGSHTHIWPSGWEQSTSDQIAQPQS